MRSCSVVLAAIGRDLDVLQGVDGFAERAGAIATEERAQPNGGLFEILVASAYARAGWQVRFNPVQRGRAKTHDLDVARGDRRYAVECKRMEGGEYVEEERARMRELWKLPCLMLAQKEQRSTYLDVRIKIEVKDVSIRYLLNRTREFLVSRLSSYLWDDGTASGVIGDLDLTPVREALKTDYLLHPSPNFNKLLTGSYRRYDNMIELVRLKYAENPHFIDDVDLAVVARWSSLSEAAVERKARDIHAKLVEANTQLPSNIPGIIHIGFEALSGDTIEHRRYEKILDRCRRFSPTGSSLEFIYCHYFAPESSPEETWAVDETVQWIGVRNSDLPLSTGMLLMPETEGPSRPGVHWDGGGGERL